MKYACRTNSMSERASPKWKNAVQNPLKLMFRISSKSIDYSGLLSPKVITR